MRKYFEIFKYGLKMNFVYIVDYMISLLSFIIHVSVFNALWDFILKDGSTVGYSRNELIWYIVMAEFITYSISRSFYKISDKVKDGTIANMLLKPINFCTYFLAEESSNILKIFINFIGLVVLGISYGGRLEMNFTLTVFVIVSTILAIAIGLLIQLIIGLLSFTMEEVRALWFIIQKLQFLLVFVPLEFYDPIIQKILFFLPTTHTVYAPARILVKYNFNESLTLILIQIIVMMITAMFAKFLYKKGVEKINANGG